MRNPEKIHTMFSSIAPRYDTANSILSFGIHRRWRKELVSWISESTKDHDFEKSPLKFLDVATGTGDVALEIKRYFGKKADVLGVDFCEPMLKVAPHKAARAKLDCRFEVADATALPYEDNSFDVATISFGIRNVSDPAKGLAELTRVLKPGGELYILEFGQPRKNWFGGIYNFYSQKVLPRVGGVVTGNKDAYSYLEDSSSQFPCGHHFLKLMQDSAPLYCLHCRPLTLGVAYLYRGVKAAKTSKT